MTQYVFTRSGLLNITWRIALLVSAYSGCTATAPDGVFRCAKAADCPPSQFCQAGLCRSLNLLDVSVMTGPNPAGADGAAGTELGAAADSAMPQGGPGAAAPGGLQGGAGSSGSTAWPAGAGASTGGASGIATSPAGAGADAASGSPGPAGASSIPAGGAAGTAVKCTCKTSDACCDGCQPKNEQGSCASDSLDCTADVCRAGACAHDLTSNNCLIQGVCYRSDQNNPQNPCLYCNATSGTRWSPRASGTRCDDGLFCTGSDTCDASGQCSLHSGDPCKNTNDACMQCAETSRTCGPSPDVTWYDSSSGLLWERQPSNDNSAWQVAMDHCSSLILCGRSDWRLPSLDELRSLVRGCPATETGGACMLTDQCLTSDCDGRDCDGCEFHGGPGEDGVYWSPELMGIGGACWTSVTDPTDTSAAMSVYFVSGSIGSWKKASTSAADSGGGRCVRTGPL